MFNVSFKSSSFSSYQWYSGFCWFLRFGLTRRPVSRLLSAIEMPHTRPQSANLPQVPSTPSVWLLSWLVLPQIGFGKQNGERRREEREKRKRRKGRERRKGEEGPANSPLNGPSAARAYELHLLSAARGPGSFLL